jgi:transposase-like protein
MKLKLTANIVEHAGTGLRMPEGTARRIEELSKGLPADFTYRRLAKSATKFRLEDGERSDVSLITTSDVDRDGDVVLPGGGDWSAYNKVVTFAHRYDELPVGSSWWIRPEGNGLAAKTHYPPKPADWGDAPWLPSAILHLMQQPVPTCTGKSIGFLPINIRGATPDEKSRRPELDGVPIVDKWAGIEYAVAPVPCNPSAEMEAVSKGMRAGVFDARVAKLFNQAVFSGLSKTEDDLVYLSIIGSYGPVTASAVSGLTNIALPKVEAAMKRLMERRYIQRKEQDSFVLTKDGAEALSRASSPAPQYAIDAIPAEEKIVFSAKTVVRRTKSAKASTAEVEPLSQTYTQYIQSGNLFEPVGDIKLSPVLGRCAYRVVPTFGGVGFQRMMPKTDDLYFFENSPMAEVLGEIDKFWGLKGDYDKLGIIHSRGVMLYGPPASGKTSVMHQVAKMIVDRGDVVFYANHVGTLVDGLQGFREVEPDRKVVVVLEDADEYVEYQERQFLQLLDGEQSVDGVLYLASTNYIERFPPRLLRSGRFDKKVYIGPPPIEGRLAFLEKKLQPFNEKPEVIQHFAKETDGMSFGDLGELVTAVYALKEPAETVLNRLRDRSAPVKRHTHGKTMDIATPSDPAKAMATDDNGEGGTVVADDDPKKPMCPKCMTKEHVIGCHGDAGRYYQCTVCGERMKEEDGGEMTDEMLPPFDNKTVPVEKVAPMPAKDPSVTCPSCREEAVKSGEQDVSGLGTCAVYSCPKCGGSFLVPPVNHRAPEQNGTTDGTANPNADGQYASNLDGDTKIAGSATAIIAAGAPAPVKAIASFVRPETIEAAIVRKRARQMASLARIVAPAAVEAVEKRLGRV